MTKKHWLMIAIFVGAAGGQIYDITSATEAPSRAVMIMQYVFVACLVFGVVATAYKALRPRQD